MEISTLELLLACSLAPDPAYLFYTPELCIDVNYMTRRPSPQPSPPASPSPAPPLPSPAGNCSSKAGIRRVQRKCDAICAKKRMRGPGKMKRGKRRLMKHPGPTGNGSSTAGMVPHRVDNDGSVFFTQDQIDIWGQPEASGYNFYHVIATRETQAPMVSEYKMMEGRSSGRPTHRYSRVERFEFTLGQLLGFKGDVPERVIEVCRCAVKVYTPKTVWNEVRAVLKRNKWRKMYNRIPYIIRRLG